MLSSNFWKKYFIYYDYLNLLIPYQKLLDDICNYSSIKVGDNVLDLGSGTGNLSVRIENLGAKVTGLDYSLEGIEIHRNKSKNSNIIFHDIRSKLPFEDNSFDKIVSNNVLYTIPRNHRLDIYKEIFRVVKPGGKVIISNISTNFNPVKLYFNHIKNSVSSRGVFLTLVNVVKLIIPTIKIIYYNFLINKENNDGGYDFYNKEEQQIYLREVGFKNISPDIILYNNQSILNFANK